MQFVRRSLTGLVMLMVSLGLLVASGLLIRDALQSRMDAGPPARPAEERVFAARVITLQPSRVHPVLTAYGEVRARRVLELRMLSGGTVTALAVGFEDGGRVIAGETLLRLDTAEAATARDLAAADVARAGAEEAEAARALSLAHDDLASAEAQAALRDQALARQRDLAERGIGSEAAVETAALAAAGADQAVVSRRQALSQAETQVALAKTATDRQKITLASAGRALADTELRAEFTGLLDGVTVSLGGSVSAGETLGRLIDPAALEVSFRVSAAQFGQLVDASGALLPLDVKTSLDVGDTDLVATGSLSRVGAKVGDGQTGRLIFAALDGTPAFRPGDFVTLRVTTPPLENAIILPAAALGADGTLLALGPENRLEPVTARLLRTQGDAVILDGTGLAGREVVQVRTPLLGAGILVNPVRPDTGDTTAQPSAMISLSPERREKLIGLVNANVSLPEAEKARYLDQLARDSVPQVLVSDLEQRVGG